MRSIRRNPTSDSLQQRAAQRLQWTISQEEADSQRKAAKFRIFLFAIACFWILIESPFSGRILKIELAFGLFFIATSVAHYWFAGRHRWGRMPTYVLYALDIAVLGALFSLMDHVANVDVPATWMLHFSALIWLMIFVAQAALSLQWRYVVWAGAWIILVRASQYAYILQSPDVYFEAHIDLSDPQNLFDAMWDPNFVSLSNATNEFLAVVGITTILAIAVTRSKRLARSQATAERQRGALARYFSPNIIDHLHGRDDQIAAPVRRDVAVMFVDIVGFTALSEKRTAEDVVVLLKAFYSRMANIVFEFGGTLDKYLGDGLMVTFNTPLAMQRPASQAIQCAVAMLDDIEQANREGIWAGDAQIRIGVGVHWGHVVTGDIGDERRLEYAVIGDTVNIASRLEAMTRAHDVDLIVSRDLLDKSRFEGQDIEGFEEIGLVPLRGRQQAIEVFGFNPGSRDNSQ